MGERLDSFSVTRIVNAISGIRRSRRGLLIVLRNGNGGSKNKYNRRNAMQSGQGHRSLNKETRRLPVSFTFTP